MLDRVLLYYPYINIEDNELLRNSLLYTDKIASIFPYESIDNEKVTDLMKMLFNENQYLPIYVEKEFRENKNEVNEFEKTFLEELNSEEFQKLIVHNQTNIEFKNDQDIFQKIIPNKITKKIREELYKKNLLINSNGNEERINEYCFNYYMASLANFLARINKNLVIPATDNHLLENFTCKKNEDLLSTLKISFDKCLPTPAPNISIKKIIDFKEKRHQELLMFREKIDELEKNLICIDNQDEIKLKMLQFKENYQIEVTNIKRLFGDSKIDLVWNTFNSLLDFKEKDLSGLIGSISGIGFISSIEFTGEAGIIAGSIVLAITGINSYKKLKRKIESNSYSYLYFAENAGIVK